MWKKSKLLILSSAMILTLSSNVTPLVVAAYDDENTEEMQNVSKHYLKVKYDEKILFHKQLVTKTIVQVKDLEGNIIDSNVLSSDDELELTKPKLTAGKMLSYWDFEQTKELLVIKPVVVDEKDILVKFTALEGGELVEDKKQMVEVLKSANKDTPLKEVLPKTNPLKGHKFAGFYETIFDEKLEDTKDVLIDENEKLKNPKNEYIAKFYPDLNDNDIDDSTEKIKVKFETDAFEKLDDVEVKVGSVIELPAMEKDDYIFYGWFFDKEFKNEYKGDVLIDDTTFYAKWEKVKEVIKEAEEKPITDKNISDQVEKQMQQQTQKTQPNKQQASKPTASTPVQDQSPKVPVINNPENKEDKGVKENKEDKENKEFDKSLLGSFTETTYEFDNKNVKKRFMVKFYDENENFIMSMTLPYGQTIKTLDENDNLKKEYGVRQNTTIILQAKDYVADVDSLEDFNTRKVRVNASEIVEISPRVKAAIDTSMADEIAAAQKELKQAQKDAKSKTRFTTILVISLLGALITGLGLFLKKRSKRNNQATE